MFSNNHTAVWGSFWQSGNWGYACCHQFSRNAYCTGRKGIEAAEAAEQQARLPALPVCLPPRRRA